MRERFRKIEEKENETNWYNNIIWKN
jgi:hypothetical protein